MFVFMVYQHSCLYRTVIHCPIHVAPGPTVNSPISHGVHVLELVAPILLLWVEIGHTEQVENDVAPSSALYVPSGHVTHVVLSNEAYVPGPHLLIGSSVVLLVPSESCSSV